MNDSSRSLERLGADQHPLRILQRVAAPTPLQIIFADFVGVVGAIDGADPRTRAVALDLISRRVCHERERHRPVIEEWAA